MLKSLLSNRVLSLLSVNYVAVLIFSMINPASWAVWIAEIIPVLLAFAFIVLTHHKFRFSNTAYILMFVWLFMHTIGAKYTFAEVPFNWFNDLIGSERNHYDRVAHYSIGFWAYPIAEYLYRKNHTSVVISTLFGLFALMSVAAGYEIIEWWYAELAGGNEGIAFLGSQGDIWDAQRDMLCDTLGAITVLIAFYFNSQSMAVEKAKPEYSI
ncbi:membrane protein [Vibrio nigripulchritudo]|uniref:DUF2238 domain-containing protein n=1 Tax=Vibrio nigripulchritudo TaxID=28173 RepID=UPI00190B3172|nr:DUF2238 domain-containing protein [Vibrio nigripulchritudo]BCL72672.1 membrane protein [Vibrio nigripulchritudo]BDU34031.1 membrane protein [Vibrio nigripulchritudo]